MREFCKFIGGPLLGREPIFKMAVELSQKEKEFRVVLSLISVEHVHLLLLFELIALSCQKAPQSRDSQVASPSGTHH